MDFSKFHNGSVLLCRFHGGDPCVVIVGCYHGTRHPHRVNTLDGRTWVCDNAGLAEHLLPSVAAFDRVLVGGPEPAASTDRLDSIEQRLSALESSERASDEMFLIANRLICVLEGKAQFAKNGMVGGGDVCFDVGPGVHVGDLVRAFGDAVTTLGLKFTSEFNEKKLVYEIKIER